MNNLIWIQHYGEHWKTVAIIWEKNENAGFYEIWLAKRPDYCDRGDWLIHVDECSTPPHMDGADGFPRYFFGSADQAKEQMETWVSRRKECKPPPTMPLEQTPAKTKPETANLE